MADISVKINTPQLDGIVKRLEPGARAALYREIAGRIHTVVDNHLVSYALSHHATADRLGATRTDNLEDAAVEASSDATGATVTVAAMGIRRALGPVEIRPKGKQALTIPVAAIAYGRKVSYLESHGIEVFRPKGKNYLATTEGSGKDAKLVPLYILAKRAILKHEPGLLPSAAELRANAIAAALAFVNPAA